MTFMATLFLALAAYAHFALPAHTAGPRKVLFTRLLLAGIGVALGLVWAAAYAGDPPLALLAFLVGFGMVHFPAALILFFKHYRGEGKS